MARHREPELAEVLFEFAYQGNVVRVSAIEPRTNTEVSMVGDPRLTQEALKTAALRKLIYVLRRDGLLR